MKRIITSVVLAFALFASVSAQTNDAAFAAEVKKSIELQHMKETFVETYKTSLSSLVSQGTISATNLDLFANEIADYMLPLLLKKVEAMYVQNFTLEEMKQMNAYFASPAGQKMIKLSPQIATESMSVAQSEEVRVKIQETLSRYLTR